MSTVDFFSCEIVYTGSIVDYTFEDLYNMAIAKVNRNQIDPYNYSKEVTDAQAYAMDGTCRIKKLYPRSKRAVIEWCYVRGEW